MKKLPLFLSSLLSSLSTYAAMNVSKIDPPLWFTGMSNPEFQLMVYGEGIGQASVSVDYPGVSLSSVVKLESNNYLLVYFHLNRDVKPGKMSIAFTLGKKKSAKDCELKVRSKAGVGHEGFDASDTLYPLMPDRFANGNSDNDQIEGMAEYEVDRNDPNTRHGGDLADIEQNLDHFTDSGVTAPWFTPALENNMRGGSYHGYATADYHKVDSRFGTNEEYRSLIDKAHNRGIKVVMDMIFNHCGVEYPWIKDMPSENWFNHSDFKDNFVQISHKLISHVDPYVLQYDFDQMNDGWSVEAMPGLNQKNPHVYKYLLQSSLWWIEHADIDGIRMDIYSYADYDTMSNWMKELNREYPNYNTVGETWATEPAYIAWWQKNSKLSAPRDSNLKTVMDFNFFDKINTAKNEETDTWFKGLDRVYSNFVYDYLYSDPASVLALIESHDIDRSLGEGENLDILKQAFTLLLTIRRIPQFYYGTGVMMNGVKSKSDGYVRKDFSGGWANDKENVLTLEGRTKPQSENYNFYRNLPNWRKDNDVIARGSMKQFMAQHGVYTYAREYNGKTVSVLSNGTDKGVKLPLKYYTEVLKDKTQGKDVISGKMIILNEELTTAPR